MPGPTHRPSPVRFTDTGTVDIDDGLTFTGAGNTFAGAISGGGALAFDGGDDTIDDGTTITTAGLNIDGKAAVTVDENLTYAGAFTSTAGTTLGVGAGQALTLSDVSGNSVIAGTLAGPGKVTVTGSLTIGNTFVAGGQLLNNGSVARPTT